MYIYNIVVFIKCASPESSICHSLHLPCHDTKIPSSPTQTTKVVLLFKTELLKNYVSPFHLIVRDSTQML